MSDKLDLCFTGDISDFERSLINLLKNRPTLVGTRPVSPKSQEKEEPTSSDQTSAATLTPESESDSKDVSPEEVEVAMQRSVDQDLAGPSLLHSLQKEMEEVFVQQPLPVALQERLSHHPAYQPQAELEVATLISELNRQELGSQGSGGCRPSAWVTVRPASARSTFHQDVVVVDLEKSDPFLHDTLSMTDPAILNLHSPKPVEKNSLRQGVASSADGPSLGSQSPLAVSNSEATPLISRIPVKSAAAAPVLKRSQFAPRTTTPSSSPGSIPALNPREEFKENIPQSRFVTPKLPKLHSCLSHSASVPKKTKIPRANTCSAKYHKALLETPPPIKKKWSVVSPVALYIHQATPHSQGPLRPVQEAALAQRIKPTCLPAIRKPKLRPATAPVP